MTKEEAIEAMREGKRVTHAYFSKEEWMTIEKGEILLEDGVRSSIRDFFSYRNRPEWDDGYRVDALKLYCD